MDVSSNKIILQSLQRAQLVQKQEVVLLQAQKEHLERRPLRLHHSVAHPCHPACLSCYLVHPVQKTLLPSQLMPMEIHEQVLHPSFPTLGLYPEQSL